MRRDWRSVSTPSPDLATVRSATGTSRLIEEPVQAGQAPQREDGDDERRRPQAPGRGRAAGRPGLLCLVERRAADARRF